jgi:plastocyanin
MNKLTISILGLMLLVSAFVFGADMKAIDVSDQAVGVKEIAVTNKGFQYIPSSITVKKGDTIRLTFTNGGGYHDWGLDEFNAQTNQITGGKSETIEFVADKAGEFEFYCSVGTHRQQGMFGAFIVVE